MTARLPRIARVGAAIALVAPALAAATAAFTTASAVAAAAAPAYQNTQTFTFDSTTGKQTFTVPPAVTQVFFQMNGAAGGRGGAAGLISGGAPGHGAEVTGTLSVTPGDTIDVLLGEPGFDGAAGYALLGGAYGGGRPASDAGGNGGSSSGATVAGTGGGGGAASELDHGDTLLALAGGGGGGGGGGGIAGYNGGSGGTGGVAGRGGTGGTGPGAGSGGGTVSCTSQGGSRVGTAGGDGTQQGGGGGGGGAGYDGSTCGGAGGNGGGVGAGGGGGGGAGASFVDTTRVPDAQFFSSPAATAGSVTFVWAQPTSSVSLTTTGYGKFAQLSATVTPTGGITDPTPTGTVDFVQSIFGSDYAIGSATLNSGVATLVTSNLSQGTYPIVARYEGDAVYAPSSKFVNFTFAPAVVASVVSGVANADPVPWGGSGTLTATIAAPAGAPSWLPSPTGTVSFYDTTGSTRSSIGSITLAAGDGNAANMPYSWSAHAASYSFEVDYDGDTNYAAATNTFTVGVTPSVLSTTTLTSSRNPVVNGQTLTFTATVKPATGTSVPSGTVTFYDTATISLGGPPASQQLGTVALGANGTASLTKNSTLFYVGQTNVITATYAGDAHMQGSTKNINLPVNPAAPPTAKAGPAGTVTSGGSTTVDGTASTDPQNEPLTYAWTQLDGPTVTFEDKNAAKTKVTAPKTSTKVVAHLRLTVTNAAGLASTSDTAITINPK